MSLNVLFILLIKEEPHTVSDGVTLFDSPNHRIHFQGGSVIAELVAAQRSRATASAASDDEAASAAASLEATSASSSFRTLSTAVRRSCCRIIAGGGVTEQNVAELIRRTGVEEVHSTAKRCVRRWLIYMTMCHDNADEKGVLRVACVLLNEWAVAMHGAAAKIDYGMHVCGARVLQCGPQKGGVLNNGTQVSCTFRLHVTFQRCTSEWAYLVHASPPSLRYPANALIIYVCHTYSSHSSDTPPLLPSLPFTPCSLTVTRPVESLMTFRRPGMLLCAALPPSDYAWGCADADRVQRIAAAAATAAAENANANAADSDNK
jgi:hypothetical protein